MIDEDDRSIIKVRGERNKLVCEVETEVMGTLLLLSGSERGSGIRQGHNT